MKKEKKISLLKECADSKKIARVYSNYDSNYYYFYPNEVSDKYLLAQEENDFQLDGFHIRKISQITKVEIKDDLCSEINVWNGVVNQIHNPNIDISSWHSIFTALQNMNRFIIIEDEINEQFAIGRIVKVCKHHLVFDHFDDKKAYYSFLSNAKYNPKRCEQSFLYALDFMLKQHEWITPEEANRVNSVVYEILRNINYL